MNPQLLTMLKSRWLIGILCLLLGAAVVLGVRFFSYSPEKVHYHANFALYINGKREEFKDSQYYTEVEMCTEAKEVMPVERAHMHDNVNNVVHVEDHAVTWGQFFTNLGWTLGPNLIASPDGTVYAQADSAKLHVILNGRDDTGLGNIANDVIKDQDKLLLSYGDENADALTKQYNAMPSTAQHYDVTPDPESCSGSRPATPQDRLKHLF